MNLEPGEAMSRRTRIVATLGPATDDPSVLRAVLEAGVDVARINFSHGTGEEQLRRIELLRVTARSMHRNVAVLADLPGPKLRVRTAGPRTLNLNAEVGFSRSSAANQSDDLTITEPELLDGVEVGQRILLDDGRLQLEVIGCERDRVVAKVLAGGELLPNKGVNLPDTRLSIAALTPRDFAALKVAAEAGVDWLALSFVRKPSAAAELREAARALGLIVAVLAKVERPEAVDRMREIVAAFDGLMVARGDLGVEIPLERVPTVQKRLIALARAAGKPVITATDMLDSMRNNPRPTRAEAGDVANAIYDGSDAVMLSGETAVGKYPIEAVACMARIAVEAESHLAEFSETANELILPEPNLDDRLTQMVVALAGKVKADAIITPTHTGRTARLVARHRPTTAIIAPTLSDSVLRQLAVVWGLQPVLMESGHDRLSSAIHASFVAGVLTAGSLVIVLAGHPAEQGERLPTIRLARVGDNGQPVEP